MGLIFVTLALLLSGVVCTLVAIGNSEGESATSLLEVGKIVTCVGSGVGMVPLALSMSTSDRKEFDAKHLISFCFLVFTLIVASCGCSSNQPAVLAPIFGICAIAYHAAFTLYKT